ncbi:hypothetical protein [Nocardia noduli]|uniref:hypothetical protein n=1 Tax=Nocardia noduli TaxID=2815722 RepID=UPI001C2509CC|nr:hypothetical protein [Nocardia noduli]
MTGLVLTPERRTELAALLEDEPRLNAEFPKVAEYLDTAPMLSGTEDEAADRAFDLRLLHYMTGGDSASRNPYWDIVAPAVTSDGQRRRIDGGSSKGSARLGFAQTILQATFAYAVPAPETLRWLREFSQGHKVFELGAGRGYWARQLADLDVPVGAYDSEPPGSTTNVSFPAIQGQEDEWYPVEPLDRFDRDLDGDSVLFLCWPPGWNDPMASTALEEFESRGGHRLIYVGEPLGGKTGDDKFFEDLAARWALASVDEQFVSWWNLGDVAQGWTRKR